MAARDRTIALLGALALMLLLVVGIGYAYLDGRDIASFAPTLLGFATPTIVALFAAAGVRSNIGRIEDKVNGNYDDLSRRNEQLAAKGQTGEIESPSFPVTGPLYGDEAKKEGA